MLTLSAALLVVALTGSAPIAPFGYEPVNPFARSRTPLALLALPDGDAASVAATFDLANTIESTWPTREVQFDAELYLWRVELWTPLTKTLWMYVRVAVGAVGPGVLDPLVDAWHGLVFGGRRVLPLRLYAPVNGFSDEVNLPGAHRVGAPGAFLSETRLGWAARPTDATLLALTLTVPTTSAPGRGLAAPGLGTWARVRWVPWSWLRVEASGGVGASAREGPLAAYQAGFFAAAALDVSVAPTPAHAFFAQLWFHTPYYQGTGAHPLDDPDLSLRVGYRARVAGLFELETGLTEDFTDGSAVDVAFHLALRR